MDRYQQASIIFELINRLRQHGSWCGEAHVQKATYLLKDLCDVPLNFDFILYKYGPFSFELRDELTAFRADGLIILEPKSYYGPRLKVTELGQSLLTRFPRTLSKYRDYINSVTKPLGARGVSDLECLATALYITKNYHGAPSIRDRVQKLRDEKPHVSAKSAEEAIREIDNLMKACPTR